MAEYIKGSPPSGGIDYEIKLQTLFSLAGIQHFHNMSWKLSNENKTAGKFDDLVFQTDMGDILLQAKHKLNGKLQESQFLSTNPKKDDFSLAKYILSHKVLIGFDIKFLVLCTNSNVKMPLLKEQNLSDFNMIENIFENCEIYKVNRNYINKIKQQVMEYQDNLEPKHIDFNEWNTLKITDNDIEEFISRFLCIKAKDGHLENTIRHKLLTIDKNTLFTVSSYKYILAQIQDWYNIKSNKATFITNPYVKSILYGEENKNGIEYLINETTAFKEYDQLEEFKLFQITPGSNYELTLKKTMQGLWKSYKDIRKAQDIFFNEVLFLNTENNVSVCEEIVDCFKDSKFKILVLAIFQITAKIIRTLNNLEEAVKTGKFHKKVIIMSEKQVFTYKNLFKSINTKVTFFSFEPHTQAMFLEKQLCFQGFPFCLKQLHLSDNTFNEIIDEDTIEKLMNSKEISFGLKMKRLDDIQKYYISRKLNKINDSFMEQNILTKCTEPIITISDQPGTGKSTLLVKLANDWKKQLPDHWILNLDLGKTTKYLKENNNNNNGNIIDFLIFHEEIKNNFEYRLIKLLKKILIFDGVDEMNFTDRISLFDFIKEISTSVDIVKIIITTRSYSFILEELSVLDNVDITSLVEFSAKDQIRFIEKYLNTDFKKSATFIENCPILFKHFLHIPLYLEMIADIFLEQIVSNTNKNESPINISNTNELFNSFMDKEKEIFIKNKCSGENGSVLMGILSDTFDRYIEDIQLLAVRKNIDTPVKDLLDIDPNKKIRNSVLLVGVLEVVGKNVRFIHKIFEEYFVAQYIWNKLKERNPSKALLKNIYREVILNREKQNICHFIDCIVETISDSQKDYLSKIFLDIVKDIEWNETSGIFSLASQGSVNLLKMLYDKYQDFPTIINRKGKYGETALLLSAHHLPTATYLIEKGADIYSKDKNGFTILHYATTKFSIFENFEFQLTSLNKSLYKDMLFHMNSVHHNIIKFSKKDKSSKRITGYQKGLILQRQTNEFKDIVNYFKNKNFYMNTQTSMGSTILHYIAYCGLINEFICLIDAGANLEIKDFYGNNIMHYAVLGGSLEIVEHLFSLGIDLDVLNLNGVAPIHFIPIGNSLKVFKFFMDNGAEIDIEDSYGRTLLFYVNSATALDLVKLIVNFGINIYKKSNDLKCTALHMASYTNSIDIVEYFIEECEFKPKADKFGRHPMHYAANGDAVKVLKYFQNNSFNLVDLVGATVLHIASVGDALNAVRYLVEHVGMDPNIKDRSDKIPLHYAARSGSLNVFQYFVERGVSTNITSTKGATVLHYTAGNKSLKMLKFILEQTDSNIDSIDVSGKHAIHYAAQHNFLEGIKYFIEIGVKVDITDLSGNNILHYSSLGNSLTSTKYIFEKYPFLNVANKDGKYPIHYSVESDSIETLRYFIKSGLSANIVLRKNVTLLHLAARSNSIKVINYLTQECNLALKQDQNGKLPYHYGAETDALDAIRYFVQRDIVIDKPDIYGCTIVHYAALSNSHKILNYCLDTLKLDPNQPDKRGKLPLHYAAETNSLKAIRTLVSSGELSNISITDNNKCTVLHWSAGGNAVEAFKFFINNYCHSVDIESKDSIGRQPIHVAIQFDSLEVVIFICNYGFDINTVDGNGNSLLHWATKYDALKVIEYFVEERNMSLRRKNNLKMTPLEMAVKHRSLKAMEYFELLPDKKCFLFKI